MNSSTIHTWSDEGATIEFHASGTSFVCTNNPNKHRQDAIKLMQKGTSGEDKEIDYIKEANNPYDDYAIRLEYKGNDVGYIPRNIDFTVVLKDGRIRKRYMKNFNQAIYTYPENLVAEVDKIVGGGKGYHLGFTVQLRKE